MTQGQISGVLVNLAQVEKVYANATVAVSDVNVSIQEGEFVSFVGPSGCGKSTIFRLIAGLMEPSRGKISVMGKTPEQARADSRISFVFQDATLMPWSDILTNVTLPLSLRGVPRKQQLERGRHVLELVGLSDYGQALPRQLSGGMKMRASIARSLISEPELLLMDEPFGALDDLTRQALQTELLAIRRQNPKMTILFITHNVYEAAYLSTRVIIMSPRPGRITAQVDVPFAYPREESLRLTPAFSEVVSQISSALQHA